MKLKVLPNPYQEALEFHERMMVRGNPLKRKEEFDLFTYYPAHPVVYSRVGYYLNADSCWIEFRLASGEFKAISYDPTCFRYDLDRFIAEESPISDKDWEQILSLLRRKVLKWCKRYSKEEERRDFKRFKRDTDRIFLDRRTRLHAKIESARRSKQAI